MERNWGKAFQAYCDKSDHSLMIDSIEAIKRCTENHDLDSTLVIMALCRRLFENFTVEIEE